MISQIEHRHKLCLFVYTCSTAFPVPSPLLESSSATSSSWHHAAGGDELVKYELPRVALPVFNGTNAANSTVHNFTSTAHWIQNARRVVDGAEWCQGYVYAILVQDNSA